MKSTASSSSSQSQLTDIQNALRDTLNALNRVKRTDVLPIDQEAEDHARDEHGGETDGAMTEEVQMKRDMESLESALDSIGSKGNTQPDIAGEALLNLFEQELNRLQELVYSI